MTRPPRFTPPARALHVHQTPTARLRGQLPLTGSAPATEDPAEPLWHLHALDPETPGMTRWCLAGPSEHRHPLNDRGPTGTPEWRDELEERP